MIQAVQASSTRVVQAYWVEFQAVLRGSATESLLTDMALDADETRDDVVRDLDSDEPGSFEEEIVESELFRQQQTVYEELLHRTSSYGDAYPFSLVERETGWTLSWSGSSPDGSPNIAALGYVAALTIAGYRAGILSLHHVRPSESRIGNVMQALSVMAARELVGGECYSFGFPREDRTTMLDACAKLVSRMGTGKAHRERPAGAKPAAKDGTVDIVAWRRLGDRLSSAVVLYGQVASGYNWHAKGVQDLIDAEFFCWFQDPPRRRGYLPALFMPFACYQEVSEPASSTTLSFREEASGRVRNDSESLGVIIDRFRLVRLLWDGVGKGTVNPNTDSVWPLVEEWISDSWPGWTAA